MTFAFIFPGQGSQSIGMGKDLYDNFKIAKDVLNEIEDALSFKLSKIMFDGPVDELTLTENTQPALLAVSMMATRVIESETSNFLGALKPKGSHSTAMAPMAGHSLGEYSALCAAGAFTTADAARSVRLRGQAMQSAVPVGVGAMAAILGLDIETVENCIKDLTQSDQLCVIANDNSPGQVVISGHKDAVKSAIASCTAAGAKRGLLLPVSAPFHSPLMQPAADVMQDALGQITFSEPKSPVIMNVTAAPLTSVEFITPTLVKQITGRVRWTESVTALGQMGAEIFVEIGSGKVLNGLVKRILPDASAISIQNADDINAFINSL